MLAFAVDVAHDAKASPASLAPAATSQRSSRRKAAAPHQEEHMKLCRMFAAGAFALAFGAAHADINVGFIASGTGPAASLGIPERNTLPLLPSTIAGQKVNYIALDDATNPSEASKAARKLTSENKVDLLIGSTTTPASIAVLEVAAESGTPLITMAPTPFAPDKAAWGFQTPQSIDLMSSALLEHMKANGVKTLAFIGYADAYGDVWWNAMSKAVDAAGIKFVAQERYQRVDTSVTGQVLKMMAANPDAVIIAGSGTPAVLPQATLVERGYKGRIYQTHGIANRDFLRVGGKNVEGTIFPVGPVLVAEQLPDSNPSKKAALEYVTAYEKAYGPNSRSTFGAHAWDAALLLQRAAPEALKKAQPGTPEFRKALRDAIEGAKDVVATHGVFNMSPTDHLGLDARARVLVKVENGDWKLLK
jgi:branched-chain amino acid transport system substrate-binding protein